VFVGHYAVSFAARSRAPSVPLWALFIAVQLLDVAWAPFVLLGIEKVRIVPGFTATNALDLYYMPYTHSVAAALLWSAGAYALCRLTAREAGPVGAALVGAAVFSHWILDLIVHVPDLALYDDTAKVGLGLWNRPVTALALEAALLFGGLWLYLRTRGGRPVAWCAFGLVMLGVQVCVFFGPPPPSDKAAAITAMAGYAIFATGAWVIERTAGKPRVLEREIT